MNKIRKKSGQMIVEYVVLFTVVCGVIILVASTIFHDNLEGMYTRFVDIINQIRPTIN